MYGYLLSFADRSRLSLACLRSSWRAASTRTESTDYTHHAACRSDSAQQSCTGQSQASAIAVIMCPSRLEINRQSECFCGCLWAQVVDEKAEHAILHTWKQKDHLIKRLKALRDNEYAHHESLEQEPLDGSFDIVDDQDAEEAQHGDYNSLPGSFEAATRPSSRASTDEFGALSAGMSLLHVNTFAVSPSRGGVDVHFY